MGFLSRKVLGGPLPLMLLGALAFLYFRLFRPPFVPIRTGGDQWIFLTTAARMFEGEMIYRDFFAFTTPGLESVHLLFFRLLGLRLWIPNVQLVLLGLSLVWTTIYISKTVLRGANTYLPASLFLTIIFAFTLDDTHRWWSTLAELVAVAVVIEKRTPRRLLGAGALCGLASFFTQTQGLLAFLGLMAFLLWERCKVGDSGREFFQEIVRIPVESSGSGFHMLSSSGNAGNSFL